jgi:hypothetical protein
MDYCSMMALQYLEVNMNNMANKEGQMVENPWLFIGTLIVIGSIVLLLRIFG